MTRVAEYHRRSDLIVFQFLTLRVSHLEYVEQTRFARSHPGKINFSGRASRFAAMTIAQRLRETRDLVPSNFPGRRYGEIRRKIDSWRGPPGPLRPDADKQDNFTGGRPKESINRCGRTTPPRAPRPRLVPIGPHSPS